VNQSYTSLTWSLSLISGPGQTYRDAANVSRLSSLVYLHIRINSLKIVGLLFLLNPTLRTYLHLNNYQLATARRINGD